MLPVAISHKELRSNLSTVFNINLDIDSAWTQATLPVHNVRGDQGPQSYTACKHHPHLLHAGCSPLINQILPQRSYNVSNPAVVEAVHVWSRGHNQPPTPTPENTKQRVWHGPHVQTIFEDLSSIYSHRAQNMCQTPCMHK